MTKFTYSVVIAGSVSQPYFFPNTQTFQRQGTLVVTDEIIDPQGITNGKNILDVSLVSDDNPATIGPDGTGSIAFFTNNALFPTRYSHDNVFESVDSKTNTLYVQPDRANSQYSVNQFASGSGLGIPLHILDGLMAVQFQNNGSSVVGVVNFLGTANSTYNVNFSGHLI